MIAEPLTRAMRGHQGLSALARTYRDYLDVIERFVRAPWRRRSAPADRDAALFWAYTRNARGFLWGDREGDFKQALALTGKAATKARGRAELTELARLGLDVAKNTAVRARRRLRER